jgi:hypothetical protein
MILNAMWALLAAHIFVSNMSVNGLAQAHGDSPTQDVGTVSTTIVSHTRASKHGDGPLGRSMQEVPCGPCSNGGSCLGNMSTCTCPDGYGGHGCSVDYTTCAHVAKSASSLTDAAEIRVALQTFDARERNVVEANTREVRRFNCSAWIGLEWRGEGDVRRSLSNFGSTTIHVPTHCRVSLSAANAPQLWWSGWKSGWSDVCFRRANRDARVRILQQPSCACNCIPNTRSIPSLTY